VVDLAAEPLTVRGDFDRLSQVFTNLLSNAAKYTDPGGTIHLSLAGASSRHERQAVVTVADSGIGIPPDELPQVFDLFSQVRSHQGHTGGGLGIGLALVRRLLQLHGGSVEAHSAGIGRGSTFTVRLPLAAAAQAPAPAPHPAALPPPGMQQGSRRVLVADDNADAADSLAELLRAMGHRVWTACDGQDALDKLAEADPEVVLLDLGMPRMDGLEAARRIRQRQGGRPLLLAALTGWGQDSDQRRTQAAGFDCHLVKPVNPEALRRLLAHDAPQAAAAAASNRR
jgi:CheY-like chemotaxis protein